MHTMKSWKEPGGPLYPIWKMPSLKAQPPCVPPNFGGIFKTGKKKPFHMRMHLVIYFYESTVRDQTIVLKKMIKQLNTDSSSASGPVGHEASIKF